MKRLIRLVMLSTVLGMSAYAFASTVGGANCECPSCDCDMPCDPGC